ncbi:MAG: glutathione S-transferase [Myxococcales bacterium]|nr:glutathione S-transferase [Myxococcales bacterium]
MSRKLYQFSISHYCEKTRWNLDAKGLDYEIVELLPLWHRIILWRIGGGTTVPVLQDGDKVIADSTRIANYLDDTYPERPLFPKEPGQRQLVFQLEDQFDNTARHIRRFMYGHMLQIPGSEQVMMRHLSPTMHKVGLTIAPVIRFSIRKNYRITPENIAKSLQKVRSTVQEIDSILNGDPNRYLVGNSLTMADIAAASLFGPLLGPPNSPWEDIGAVPETIANERSMILNRTFGKWVYNRYRLDRRRT